MRRRRKKTRVAGRHYPTPPQPPRHHVAPRDSADFKKDDRIMWSDSFLKRGKEIDPEWFALRKNERGTVDWIQRDGDVIVQWDNEHTTTVHPPDRLAHATDRVLEDKHQVADFNTLDDLIDHARRELGATHIDITTADAAYTHGTQIYFPHGDGYMVAKVWYENGYFHAQGPSERSFRKALPAGVQPIAVRRGASREVVRDYEAVDNRGRHIAGPFKSYGDAKSAAGPAGHVKYVRPGVSEARQRTGVEVVLQKSRHGWSAVLLDRQGRSINLINGGPGDSKETVERAARKHWPGLPIRTASEASEARRAPKTGRMSYSEWTAEVAGITERMGIRYEDVSTAFWRSAYQGGLSPWEAADEALRQMQGGMNEHGSIAQRFRVGSRVVMNEDALANYGERWQGIVFTVTAVSTAYMPADEFFAKGRPAGYHPGFDPEAGSALYDLAIEGTGEHMDNSFYDWELEPALPDRRPGGRRRARRR